LQISPTTIGVTKLAYSLRFVVLTDEKPDELKQLLPDLFRFRRKKNTVNRECEFRRFDHQDGKIIDAMIPFREIAIMQCFSGQFSQPYN
jgi:hypothetical protein